MRVLVSTDSVQASESVLAADTPPSGRLQGINGQPLPPAGDKAIEALQRALTSARENHQSAVTARMAALLGLAYFEQFNLFEARQRSEEVYGIFRALGNVEQQTILLGNLALVDFYLGDGTRALVEARQAVEIARNSDLLPLAGYLLCGLGAIECYAGQYGDASETLDEARLIFVRADDSLGSHGGSTSTGASLRAPRGILR